MKKYLQKVDELIAKIPGHVQDLIKKGAMAFAALIAIISIALAIKAGVQDAVPAGMQVAADSRDLFYLRELREENTRRRQLVEDVETDPLQFPSVREQNIRDSYRQMGKDRADHLMGEKDEMLENTENPLRPSARPFDHLPVENPGSEVFTPQVSPESGSMIRENENEQFLPMVPEKNKVEKFSQESRINESIQKENEAEAEKEPLRRMAPPAERLLPNVQTPSRDSLPQAGNEQKILPGQDKQEQKVKPLPKKLDFWE